MSKQQHCRSKQAKEQQARVDTCVSSPLAALRVDQVTIRLRRVTPVQAEARRRKGRERDVVEGRVAIEGVLQSLLARVRVRVEVRVRG
jgi:hypothetical protein